MIPNSLISVWQPTSLSSFATTRPGFSVACSLNNNLILRLGSHSYCSIVSSVFSNQAQDQAFIASVMIDVQPYSTPVTAGGW